MNIEFNDERLKPLTYLEFGSIRLDERSKNVWDFRTDQEAYDFFMLARYAKEILAFRDGADDAARGDFGAFAERYRADVHTQDYLNTVSGWAGLSQVYEDCIANPIFFELGSTIFGCIEAFASWREIIGSGPAVKDCRFRGLEISSYLARLGELLHPGNDIITWLDTDKVEWKCDLFFAKGVTLLYAIRTPEDLLRCLKAAGMGLFDYNFSLNGCQEGWLGTGKHVTYISLEQFLASAESLPEKLYVRRSDARLDEKTERARCHFIWGEPEKISLWLRRMKDSLEILRSKDSSAAETLLNGYAGNPEEDYIEVVSADLKAILEDE